MGQRYRRIDGQKLWPVCVAHNHDFPKGELQPTVMKFFPKMSKLGDVVS